MANPIMHVLIQQCWKIMIRYKLIPPFPYKKHSRMKKLRGRKSKEINALRVTDFWKSNVEATETPVSAEVPSTPPNPSTPTQSAAAS